MKKRKPKLNTITVSIPPYGRMSIVGPDGDDALPALRSNWQKLWPGVRRNLKSMIRGFRESLEAPIRLKEQKWAAEGCTTDPDCFMGDLPSDFSSIRDEVRAKSDERPYLEIPWWVV